MTLPFDLFSFEKRAIWTFWRCRDEALKYKYRKDFERGSRGAYESARQNGWLVYICAHMTRLGDKYNRFVYVLVNRETNQAYAGLTNYPERRLSEHRSNPAMVKSFGKYFCFDYLSKLMTADEAVLIEAKKIDELREIGFTILNSATAGSLGKTRRKWDFDTTAEKAKLCKTKTEFRQRFPGAFHAAHKGGWSKAICAHMEKRKAPNKKWDNLTLCAEALKYITKKEFREKSGGAYTAAKTLGLVDEICSHMPKRKKSS